MGWVCVVGGGVGLGCVCGVGWRVGGGVCGCGCVIIIDFILTGLCTQGFVSGSCFSSFQHEIVTFPFPVCH